MMNKRLTAILLSALLPISSVSCPKDTGGNEKDTDGTANDTTFSSSHETEESETDDEKQHESEKESIAETEKMPKTNPLQTIMRERMCIPTREIPLMSS